MVSGRMKRTTLVLSAPPHIPEVCSDRGTMIKTLFIATVSTFWMNLALAQSPSRSVVKLTSNTQVSENFGSGVCLDTPCLHVLTDFHVVALLGTALKVEGVGVASVRSATGPEDTGAIEMSVAGSVFKYNPARDLTLLTLRHPLPSSFQGLALAEDSPSLGQRVQMVARHRDTYDTATGNVVAEGLQYKSAGHLVEMPGHFLMDCISRPGNSGGAVIDANGKLLGLVEIHTTTPSDKSGTSVLPAKMIVGFLREWEPRLSSRLFGEYKADSSAVREFHIDPPVKLDHPPVMPAGADPQALALALQSGVAKSLAAMQQMVARQSVRFWGQGERERSAIYEVAMYSDGQLFRTVAGTELTAGALPSARSGVLLDSEWHDTMALIGSVHLDYLGTSTHSNEAVEVFSFHSKASDAVCSFRERTATLVGHKDETRFVACDGIVVADKTMNVLGIARGISPGFGSVSEWQALTRYGRVKLQNSDESYILPLSTELSLRFKNGKSYNASEVWSDYHVFGAESILRLN